MAKAPTSDRAAIKRVTKALEKAGVKPTFMNGGDGSEDISTLSAKAVLNEILDYDDVCVFYESVDKTTYIELRFVMGNDPSEVVCDWWPYSENLDSLSKVVDTETTSWWH